VGHTSYVMSVAYNSMNDTIISGSEDKTVRLWDASSGKELHKLEGHTSFVLSVAYNSSNDTIISGSEDTTVRVWMLQVEKNSINSKDTLRYWYQRLLCYLDRIIPNHGY